MAPRHAGGSKRERGRNLENRIRDSIGIRHGNVLRYGMQAGGAAAPYRMEYVMVTWYGLFTFALVVVGIIDTVICSVGLALKISGIRRRASRQDTTETAHPRR